MPDRPASSPLTQSRLDKLEYLERLCPADAAAIELLIDDCLDHRQPRTPAEWFAVAERLSARH